MSPADLFPGAKQPHAAMCSSDSSTHFPKITSVCIIGAGPSGLAAAKYLLAEHCFTRIIIYEQGANVGGLWNYVPSSEVLPEKIPIPQTNPDLGVLEASWQKAAGGDDDGTQTPQFLTSIYDHLETNIPRDLMGFSDLDWPDDIQLFPQHQMVLRYIEQYGRDVRHLVQFQTQVLEVVPQPSEKWIVRSQKISKNPSCHPQEEMFDAVIVANGHFTVPYIPPVPGIQEWNASYPGVITHSRYYRSPDFYVGKKVIVVGNSASGTDIGSQISATCKQPLFVSSRSESLFLLNGATDKIDKPAIAAFKVEDRSVIFEDGSIEAAVDAVLYCTGYLYSFPFLKHHLPQLISTGERVQNTYQHMFFYPLPTLAFVGLNQKVIPFVVSESQSAIISRVFSGRLALPSAHEMQSWEDKLVEKRRGKAFHVLNFPEDADYVNMLHEWAEMAVDEQNHADRYRAAPYWDERARWVRKHFSEIKKTFQDLKENRHQIKTLEQIGFDYS